MADELVSAEEARRLRSDATLAETDPQDHKAVLSALHFYDHGVRVLNRNASRLALTVEVQAWEIARLRSLTEGDPTSIYHEAAVQAWRIAELEALVDEKSLAIIEARNPGIDMDEVRAIRAGASR